MTDVQIRRARAEDEMMIRRMVKAERLDPSSLNWLQFLVAEKGVKSSASARYILIPTAVSLAAYREQGIGEMLVRALLENETGDVYLECVKPSDAYYAKFGFDRIAWWRAPMPLKAKAGLWQ